MKFGLQHPNYTFDGENGKVFDTLSARARSAEEGGFDSFWVMDHFIQIPMVGTTDQPMLEGWSTISSLIGVTKKIRLGTLVTGNIYRNPALLAKMGATVDVLSGGRLFMGVGAGWFEKEAEAYGIPHYDVPERLRRLGEALQIIRGMWSSDGFSFEGKYYRVSDAFCVPKPVQKPHPPILIGGGGEKVTLRLVARYGDACNLTGGAEMIRHKLEVLREHCRAVGRDYDEILKTKLGHLVIARDAQEARSIAEGEGHTPERLSDYVIYGTPDRVKQSIEELAAAGVEYLILNIHARKEEAMLRLFAEEVVGSIS
ncbi:MAG: LLM class F420-dependent oxidoreductase [Nitrososphaerales archaeon]|jgi:F420-dependent oxidoreductase-like protein